MRDERRWDLAARVVLVCAAVGGCGDDTSGAGADTDAATETGTGSGGSSSTVTDDSTSTASTGSLDTSSTGSASELEVQTQVTLHPEQPMVVDIEVTTSAPAEVELVHATDDGVRIEHVTLDPQTHAFRARGLAPATLHQFSYTATAAGASTNGDVELTTEAPLPGFVPSFEVSGGPVDEARPFRMFDLTPFPAFTHSGVFMVDAQGVTRWHLGGPTNGMIGPEGIWTSVKLLDDASIVYLHLHEFYRRNELGEELLHFADDELGQTGLHHEVLQLPSGNFMALTHTFQTVTYDGQGDLLVAGDGIVEFTADGEVVWTWDAFDHVDPQRVRAGFDPAALPHPETGELAHDWTHGNGIELDEETDTLLVSLRHQDWILKIDHATGEVLWRLGDEGDFELTQGQWFFHQHSPQWQPDGSLLLYDNAVDNPGLPAEQWESRAVRYELDEVAMTATQVWEGDAEPFVSTFAGDADRLPSGRYLVTDSSINGDEGIWARVRELDPQADPMLQWSLQTEPGHFIYRATAHDRLVGEAAP